MTFSRQKTIDRRACQRPRASERAKPPLPRPSISLISLSCLSRTQPRGLARTFAHLLLVRDADELVNALGRDVLLEHLAHARAGLVLVHALRGSIRDGDNRDMGGRHPLLQRSAKKCFNPGREAGLRERQEKERAQGKEDGRARGREHSSHRCVNPRARPLAALSRATLRSDFGCLHNLS